MVSPSLTRTGSFRRRTVDEGPVGAAQVGENRSITVRPDAGVDSRDLNVRQVDLCLLGVATDHRFAGNGNAWQRETLLIELWPTNRSGHLRQQ